MESHKLKIVRQNDRKTIVYTSIDMSAGTEDSFGFKYKKINPVVLEAGRSYYIMSLEDSTDLRWNSSLIDITANLGALIVGSVWTDYSGTRYYTLSSDMNTFPFMPGSSTDTNGQLMNLKCAYGTAIPTNNLAIGAKAYLWDNYNNPQNPSMGTSYASNAVDNDAYTLALASGSYAWSLKLDLGSIRTNVNKVAVNFASSLYATEYRVYISSDNLNWSEVLYEPNGTGGRKEINFSPTDVRYVIVRSLKPDGPGQTGAQMAISELEVYNNNLLLLRSPFIGEIFSLI